MQTEAVIYRQQLVANPKFTLISDYGWDVVGSTWVREDGLIRKTNTIAGTLTQEGLLVHGVSYKLKFRLTSRTTGTLTFTNRSGGTTHLTTGANQIYEVDFIADGTDIIFTASTTFNGTITNVSLVQTPVKYNLDLTEDVSIPLNFCIDDFFKVSQRKTTFSKGIKFPGTHNNNRAFNHLYKLNTESLYIANRKSRITFKNSGLNLFDGDLILDDIEEKLYGGIRDISYHGSVMGDITTIYTRLGAKTIKDLDFSKYDHDFTIDRIYGSWWNDITINGATGQTNKTTTYTSPAITAETAVVVSGLNRIKLTFAAPHSFVAGDEVYVDPGGLQSIYAYDQTVLSVPSNTEIILTTTRPLGFTGTMTGTVKKQQLDGIGYWYPCVNYGTWIRNNYPVGIKNGTGLLEIGVTYIIKTYNTGDDFTNVGGLINNDGEIFTATGTTPTAWTGSVLITLRDTNSEDQSLASKWGTDIYEATDNYWEAYDFIPHIFVYEVWAKMLLLAGYTYDCPLFDTKFFKRLIIPLDQKFDVLEGATISFNDWLPNMKLSDLFNSVLNMFNLAVVPSGDDKTILRFLNRGDFFDNPIVDWTDKVHAGEPLKISLMNKNLPKSYQFKYKDSTDFYNTDYNTELGNKDNEAGLDNPVERRYGDYYAERDTDFLTEESKTELAFEPSVLVGPNTVSGLSGILMPACFDASLGQLNINRKTSNRILIAGLRALTTASFNLVSNTTPADNKVTESFYPYAGHIDNHFADIPTWDLNFGTPLGTYFDGNILTVTTRTDDEDWDSNGLYKRHWQRYINQITDPNARVVKGVFRLKAIDIYNLDFTAPVRVNDLVLKLNRVIDWDINGDGICDVEFLLKT
jgi:hypothetical protein